MLTVISDKQITIFGGYTVSTYEADVVCASDAYPFRIAPEFAPRKSNLNVHKRFFIPCGRQICVKVLTGCAIINELLPKDSLGGDV